MVETEQGSYLNISVAELETRLQQEQPFLFINTHIPYEGEIAGTDAFIPFDQIENYYGILPKDKTSEIIVYCMSGRMSEIASEALVAMGYSNVKNVVGGMRAWAAADLDIKDSFAGIENTGVPNLDAISARLGVSRNRFVTADITGDATMGQASAQLVLVEYSDVNCPYCAKFHIETLPQLVTRFIDTGELQYVYRDFVSVGGRVSQEAAESAECLREQVGDVRYFELINGLYAVDGRKTASKLLELAAEVDYDQAAFDTCMNAKRYSEEVLVDQAAGQQAGIRGTPGFILGYINEAGVVEGVMFQGALPAETFDGYIRALLEANN